MNNLQPDNSSAEVYFEEKKIEGIFDLLKNVWTIYKAKSVVIFEIFVPLILVSLLRVWLLHLRPAESYFFVINVASILIWAAYLYVWVLSVAAVIYAVKDNTGFIDAYKNSSKNSKNICILLLVLMLINVGGFMLLLIPGVIFSVWFSFALYVHIFEGIGLKQSIFKSKQLVSGNFWNIFGKQLVFGMIIAAIILVILIPVIVLQQMLLSSDSIQIVEDLSGFIFKLISVPLFLIFQILLYENLIKIRIAPVVMVMSKKQVIGFSAVGLLGSPLILLVIFLQLINIFGQDGVLADDGDIRATKIEISKDSNAFYNFQKSQSEIVFSTEEQNALAKWDQSLVDSVILKNNKALIDFEMGVQKNVFQDPELQDPSNLNMSTITTPIASIRNIAKLNNIVALNLYNQGKEREAFLQELKAIKMAEMLKSSPNGSMIMYLTGLSAGEIVLDNMRAMVKQSNLESSELGKIEKMLDQYSDDSKDLASVLKMEYANISNTKKEMIDPVFRGEKPAESIESIAKIPSGLNRLNFYYQPNETQNLFAAYYRQTISNSQGNVYVKTEVPSRGKWRGVSVIFTKNVIGKILRDVIAISYDGLFKRKYQSVFSLRATRLMLAIKSYQNDNNSLPESLDGLVPKYISEIPQDPFGGQSIMYSRDKQIIYSIGENMTDEGGSTGDDWQSGNDLVFSLK